MPHRQGSDTPRLDLHAALHGRFGWQVPERFNMAEVCSRRWAADPQRARMTAVIDTAPGQPDRTHSYADLQAAADRLSNVLASLGVRRADGVPMPAGGEGALLLPAGRRGPAFVVTSNFRVIRSYNNSAAYMLGVALLIALGFEFVKNRGVITKISFRLT